MSNLARAEKNRLSPGELDGIQAVVEAVDAKGRAMDEKWGIGRLPTLVPADWAEKFRVQQRKFSAATLAWDLPETMRHGQAMERAYARLDELAVAAGFKPGPAEQWEFETPNGLVILVRDIRQTNQVDTGGRRAEIWSLDEVVSVIRAHPAIVAAKTVFEGATVVSIRPSKPDRSALTLDDDVPF